MKKNKIYDFVGKETLTKEYKEFRLNYIYKYFTNEEIKSWLLDKSLIDKNKFNKMVMNQIQTYIYNYLPKYIGNFSNAQLDGQLFFGINDNGIIDGIPFYGDIDIKIIKKYIFKMNKYNQIINNDYDIRDYYKDIKIDIIKVNKNYNIDEKSKYYNEFNKFNERYNDIIKQYQEYKIKYEEWQKIRVIYSGKLSNYIENISIRNEIIDFIFSKLHLYTDKKDRILIYKSINRWKSDEIFNTKIYIDDIIHITNDLSHPLKWLIDYKLLKLEEIKKSKPLPNIIPDKYCFLKYMNDINNIRYKLESLDNNLNYYIIKIYIKYIPDSIVIYRKPNTNKWISKQRYYCKYNGPSCM